MAESNVDNNDRQTVEGRNGSVTRVVGIMAIAGLAVYSAAILVTEWRTSQDHIRLYLGDIEGDVTFYLVNTSLSVFLLWATALLVLVALRCTPPATDDPSRRFRWFLWSQVAIFALLGLDDRFQVHEKTAARLGDVPDHFVLAAVGLVQVVCLVTLAPRHLLRETPGKWFAAGAFAFAVMLGIDALAPEDGRLRLSLEDLVKAWAAFFFLVAAWTLFERQLERRLQNVEDRPEPDASV